MELSSKNVASEQHDISVCISASFAPVISSLNGHRCGRIQKKPTAFAVGFSFKQRTGSRQLDA
jgi:hypothetical protein